VETTTARQLPRSTVQVMDRAADTLALAGAYLAGVPTLSAEWSLQINGARAQVRDRVIFWVGPGGDAYARLGQLLARLGVPAQVLAMQARLAPHSLRQGVGLRLADSGPKVCLYLHHVEPASGAERHDSFKWHGAAEVDYSYYEVHFLPATPAGAAPADLVHPALAPLYQVLAAEPRIRAMCGFWLRHRHRRVNQVSLTYPWQPALGSVAALFGGPNAAGTDLRAGLGEHAGRHLRHLAFSAREAGEPSITAYFCGALGAWPTSFAQLRTLVDHSAAAVSAAVEAAIFKGLPLPDPDAPRQDITYTLDPAYLQRAIPHGSSVYVIGCGRGEVATYLWRELGCRVIGVTADRAKFRYCAARGLQVRHASPVHTLPPGKFDFILILGEVGGSANLNGFLVSLQRFGDCVLLNSGHGLLSAWSRDGIPVKKEQKEEMGLPPLFRPGRPGVNHVEGRNLLGER
jgi:hypothetical protein